MITSVPSSRVLFYVGSEATPMAATLQSAVLARLLDRGICVQIVSDEASLKSLIEKSGICLVLGNFAGQVPCKLSGDVRDISGLDPDGILAVIDGPQDVAVPGARRWKPWFPVIDFNRCTNCMQCLSFCLFDVYGVTTGGKIQVQNENNCKTDCPACSRVCPEVAIMFPKYKAGPINGDEISSEDVRREAMKVDISALLGGDIFSMLRDRSEKAKSRFSKERDDERALKERQRCLDKLKSSAGDFDIPVEVLASLPSAEQIQLKAEQARKRAAEALERQAATKSNVGGGGS